MELAQPAAVAVLAEIGDDKIRGDWNGKIAPWLPRSDRQAAAQHAVAAVSNWPYAVIGGDFNACGLSVATSHHQCDGHDADGSDLPKLEMANLTDAFSANESEPAHCSNKRIDAIFFRGPYSVEYDACQVSAPSDHPFVLVALTANP